jgi:hypothetical protein
MPLPRLGEISGRILCELGILQWEMREIEFDDRFRARKQHFEDPVLLN